MKFTVPFSQIIDVDGLEADFDSEVEIIPSKCVIVPKADENSVLECELVLLVNITAVKYATCELVTDAYSTKYECECGFIDTKPQLPPIKQEVSVSVQSSLSCSDGEISQVYDMWCESPTVSARYDEDKEMYMLYGKVNFCALCKLSDGSVGYAEKESAFEEPLNMGDKDCAALNVAADAAIDGCSYTLSENGSIDAKAQLTITAKYTENCCPALMESVEVLKDKPKDCDKSCAVKICYSDKTTSLWEIAKKYSTSAAAITEENRLDEKAENGRRVLIIPMKN